ncbi:VWA domain-containing protein, partial [Rhizobium sp. AAP43]|uniref:T1SS-143 repeat domain-containing protein n=1 Tax=Rhizobium sp. AAP43 TaxID=1523420 RepID=UPI0006CDB6AC
MSIEDPRLSSIDNTSAGEDFAEAVEQHLGFTGEADDGIEVAQAETPNAPKSDRLSTEVPTETAAAAIPTQVVPDTKNVVTLPATVDLDNVEFKVEGADLVLVLADGTEIIVQGGAANIPTFVIGEVELPQVVLFAALEDSNINVAAGPDGSYSASGQSPGNGGDFNDSPFGDGFGERGLIDLLGDTSFGDEQLDGEILGDGAPSIDAPLTVAFEFDEAVIADNLEGNESFSGVLPFNPGPDFGTITGIGFVGAGNVAETAQGGDGSATALSLTSGGLPIVIRTFPAPSDGTDLSFTALQGVVVIDGVDQVVFEIRIDNRETGEFTFELIGQLDHPDAPAGGSESDLQDLLRLGFTYTVTDLDGDSVTGTFDIDVKDDAVSFGTPDTKGVDEDFTPWGNGDVDTGGQGEGGSDNEQYRMEKEEFSYPEVSGSLGINWGADKGNAEVDGGLTGVANDRGVAFTAADIDALEDQNLTSDGVALVYKLADDGTTLIAYKLYSDGGEEKRLANVSLVDGEEINGEVVFTVSLSDVDSGSYTFTLKGNLDHKISGDSPADEEDLSIKFQFTAQDADGDTATSSFTVNVNDDSPIFYADPESKNLDEENVVQLGGNDGDSYKNGYDLGGEDDNGYDDESRGGRSVNGQLYIGWGADDNNDSTSVADRSVVFTGIGSGEGFENGSAIEVSQLDAEGTTELTHNGETVRMWLSEDGTTLYGYVGEVVEGGPSQSQLVFSVSLSDNGSGSYVFTLYKNLDHAFEGREDDIRINFQIKATDSDGDSATANFSVDIDDDAPVASNVTASTVLDDEAQSLFTGNNSPADDVANELKATGVAGSLFTAGADGVKSVEITGGAFNVIFAEGGFAKSESVTWGAGDKSEDGTTTFTATSTHYPNGAAVLIIKADGSYSLELKAPVAHTAAGEDNTEISVGFTVTDGDGDTASGTLVVTVNDDVPVATPIVNAPTKLDDEAQSVFPGNDGSNIFKDATDANPNYKVASGNAGALFTAGADGVQAISVVAPTFSVIFKDTLGFAGQEVVTWGEGQVQADGTVTLVATSAHYGAPDGAATLVIGVDGSYKLTLNAPVVHSTSSSFTEEDKTLSFEVTVTDGDGDKATSSLNVTVDDDTPEPVISIEVASKVLDDEAQTTFTPTNPGGFLDVPDEKSVSGGPGSLFKMGADGLAGLSVELPSFDVIAKGSDGFAKQECVNWGSAVRSEGGVTTYVATSAGYPNGAAVLTIKADGSYTLELKAPVAHDGSIFPENNEVLVFGYAVRDGDGDVAVGLLKVLVNDDTPVAKVVSDLVKLDDEAQTLFPGNNDPIDGVTNELKTTGVTGSLFSAGADGVSSVSISGGAFKVVFAEGGFAQSESVKWGPGEKSADGTTTFTATSTHYPNGAAVLIIKADGSYSLELKAPVAHTGSGETDNTITVGFTVTDGDGDKASGKLNILVNDDVPVANSLVWARDLDDEAQTRFTPVNYGGRDDEWPSYGQASGSAGALFKAGSDGVGSITINAASFAVLWKDGGFATTETATWDAGVKDTNGNTTFTATGADSDQVAAVLVIKADGSYTLEMKAPLVHDQSSSFEDDKTLSIGFTVTDGDGDTASGTLKVSVDDDTPEANFLVVERTIMDDEAQSLFTPVNYGGFGDVFPSVAKVTGDKGALFSGGADGVTYVRVDGPDFRVIYNDGGFAKTESICWVGGNRDGSGNTAYFAVGDISGKVAAMLVINADGSYSFELKVPVAHNFSSSSLEDTTLLPFAFTVIDGDGDKASGYLKIAVNDDIPVFQSVVNASTTLDDEAQTLFAGNELPVDGVANALKATGIAGSLFTAGADGVKSVEISGGAFKVVFAEGGFAQSESVKWGPGEKSADGTTTFTAKSPHYPDGAAVLVIKADGSYSLELKAPVAHDGAGEDSKQISIGFTVTDGDGDTAKGSLTVTVNDDTPVSAADPLKLTVDEDGLLNAALDTGKPTEVTPVGASASTSGSLLSLFTFGADGAHATEAVTLKATTTPVNSGLTSQDDPIMITVANGKLTGTADGRVVFELTVEANGSYHFQLKDQIDHPDLDGVTGDNSENLTSLDLSQFIIGKDGDGDTVTLGAGKLLVDIRDDVPTVSGAPVAVEVQAPMVTTPVEGKVANFVLVLDTSGSVTVTALKAQVTEFLNKLADSGAEDVRVHIVQFKDTASPVGTFDLIVDGDKNVEALSKALSAVNAFTGGGNTNYEAGLLEAQQWIDTTNTLIVDRVLNRFEANQSSNDINEDDALIIGTDDGQQVALVSGWLSSGTTTVDLQDVYGNTNDGMGVDNPEFSSEATDLNVGERLRFDFGTFNDFDVVGAGYENRGSFNGVPVTSAAFKLDDNNGSGSTSFTYTVHFVGGGFATTTIPVNNDNTQITIEGTGANAGKQIAYVEFSTSGEGRGDVDLVSVKTAGPLLDADVNKVIFISDGEPNRALNQYGNPSAASPQDAIDESQNEIGAIKNDSDGTGPQQAFTIDAYGINVNTAGLLILDQVEGQGGDAEVIDGSVKLSDLLAGVINGLGGTQGQTGSAVEANFDLGNLVKSGVDEEIVFSIKGDFAGLTSQALTAGGQGLSYAAVGNLLTATANGATVFTLSLDADGDGTFTLSKPLDGQVAKAIDFSSIIQATDFDGDAVTLGAGKFVVTVQPPDTTPPTVTITSDETGTANVAGGT